MLPRASYGLLLLPVLACSLAAEAQSHSRAPAPVLTIEDLGKGEVTLDGPWQFHLGDNMAWAAPDFNDATGQDGWEQIKADGTWGAQTHPGYTGFAWYRKHIHVTPAPGFTGEIAVRTLGVESASEVYWNGVLAGKNGKLPPHPVWDQVQRSQVVKLGAAHDGVLAFRVWEAPPDSSDADGTRLGGFENLPEIGDLTQLDLEKDQETFRDLRWGFISHSVSTLYGLIGLFSLVGWLRRRDTWILFWLSLFALNSAMSAILDPNAGSFARVRIQMEALRIGEIASWYFLLYLLRLDTSRRWRVATLVASILTVLSSVMDAALALPDFGSPAYARIYPGLSYQLSLFDEVLGLYTFVLFAGVYRRRLDLARWIIAASWFLAVLEASVEELAWYASRYIHWNLNTFFWRPLFQIGGFDVYLRNLCEAIFPLALVFAYFRFTRESDAHHQRLEEELKNASELQRVIVPAEPPKLPGYELTSAYRPAQEVGGDFFQIIPPESDSQGSTWIMLGDVSGKGLKAAMAVSLIIGMIRALAASDKTPAELMSGMNRRLCGRLQGGFATCILMRVDPGGRCSIASAGHLPPFLNGKEIALPPALPLGLSSGTVYEEVALNFRAGDHFALYTDGLLEARSRSGELFGFERLAALFATRPNAADATDAGVQFGQDDDITVLTLVPLATGAEAKSTLITPIAEASMA